MKFARVLKADPVNTIALLHEGQDADRARPDREEPADPGRGRRKRHARNAHDGALQHQSELRESQAKFTLTHPNLAPLRQQMADAQSRETASRRRDRDPARRRPRPGQVAIDARIQNISYGVPDFSRVSMRPGGRLDAVIKNLNAMGRSIDAAFGKSSRVIAHVGTIEKNKESGLVKENDEILTN
jgi:hypothetical protein